MRFVGAPGVAFKEDSFTAQKQLIWLSTHAFTPTNYAECTGDLLDSLVKGGLPCCNLQFELTCD